MSCLLRLPAPSILVACLMDLCAYHESMHGASSKNIWGPKAQR